MSSIRLVGFFLSAIQSDPEEIRRALQEEIQRAKARLERLDAAVARAERETEAALRAIEGGEGTAEEKRGRKEKVKADQNRLAVAYYYLGDPVSVPPPLSSEAADSIKKATEQVTQVLRSAETYFQSLDRNDTSKARAFVHDAGWQVAKFAEAAVATAKQLEKGIRILPDDRPLGLARSEIPDPLTDVARIMEAAASWNVSAFERLVGLVAERRGREAAELAQRMLDANRVCLARMRRAQMILESFSQAQTELDEALEKALPMIRAGVLAAPTEIAKLKPARETFGKGLQYFLDGLNARSRAVQAATRIFQE